MLSSAERVRSSTGRLRKPPRKNVIVCPTVNIEEIVWVDLKINSSLESRCQRFIYFSSLVLLRKYSQSSASPLRPPLSSFPRPTFALFPWSWLGVWEKVWARSIPERCLLRQKKGGPPVAPSPMSQAPKDKMNAYRQEMEPIQVLMTITGLNADIMMYRDSFARLECRRPLGGRGCFVRSGSWRLWLWQMRKEARIDTPSYSKVTRTLKTLTASFAWFALSAARMPCWVKD